MYKTLGENRWKVSSNKIQNNKILFAYALAVYSIRKNSSRNRCKSSSGIYWARNVFEICTRGWQELNVTHFNWILLLKYSSLYNLFYSFCKNSTEWSIPTILVTRWTCRDSLLPCIMNLIPGMKTVKKMLYLLYFLSYRWYEYLSSASVSLA